MAAYLYTRRTGHETLAASFAGTGLSLVSVFLLQIYLVSATGSTESLAEATLRLLGWLSSGTILVVLGSWLYRTDLSGE
ncbi:hypothetical protein ACFQE1_19315 [Halobium palmae]|uniref:Uncharacterized protein n=1 Tax=Halobium palmae TaxID=1776492 RepID=A0ABD5S642_9EURY